MLEYQDRTVQEVASCTCDRCQKRMMPDDPDWHEKVSVAFRGGFDSIFGDGNEVSLDLCQQCVKETLGAWLRITPLEGDGLEYQARIRAEWDGREGGMSQLRPAPPSGLEES